MMSSLITLESTKSKLVFGCRCIGFVCRLGLAIALMGLALASLELKSKIYDINS